MQFVLQPFITGANMRTAIAAFLLFLSGTAQAQFSVSEPPNQQVLGPVLERLGAGIDTNGPIHVTVRPCGQENAWWDKRGEITYCQEILQSINRKQQSALQTGKIDRQAIAKTAAGEMIFILFHELGHALIQRHSIPFTGREEDAADQFAAWMIMKMNDPSIYLGATNFFAEPSRLLRVFGNRDRRLMDEHGLNVQRRAQLVCWGYGRDQATFATFASHLGLPQNRLQRCGEEYQQLMKNTPQLFGKTLKLPADQPTPQAKSTISESSQPYIDASSLATRHKCLACHALDNRIIGPAFRDVASKYRGTNAEQALIAKVKLGGSGTWGPVPMPPNSGVPDDDLKVLVQWITSL